MKKGKNNYIILAMVLVIFCVRGGFTASTPLKASKNTLYTGTGMTVTFKPSKLDNSKLKKAKWSVKNGTGVIKITTRNPKGKTKIAVKGKKAGTAYVCLKYGKKTYKIKVVVKNLTDKKTTEKKTTEKKSEQEKTTEKPATEEQKPEQTSALTVTTSVSTADLRYGDTVQVTANQPVYVAAASRDYFSDFPVVTVSDDGVITAKYVGSTEVLVTTSRIKANDWTVNGNTHWTGSDCQYVKITVGYDKLQPQFTDYELKPAIDPAVRHICKGQYNLFYVSNHVNTRTLRFYNDEKQLQDYNTYSKDGTSYGIAHINFAEAGQRTVDIYERNPSPDVRQAYSGSYLDQDVYCNTVTVAVEDGWETLMADILATYPERDEQLFWKAWQHVKDTNKANFGSPWYYQIKTVYGAGRKLTMDTDPYEWSGDCLGEASYVCQFMTHIVEKVPELSAYEFKVEASPTGGIGHVNCNMYKNGEKVECLTSTMGDLDFLIADFDPLRDYVIKWTVYGDRTTAELLAAEQTYEYTEYGK